MKPSTVYETITKEVSDHFAMNVNMGGEASEAPEEVLRVAIRIYSALLGDQVMEFRSLRQFVEDCGVSKEFAEEWIDEENPDCIY